MKAIKACRHNGRTLFLRRTGLKGWQYFRGTIKRAFTVKLIAHGNLRKVARHSAQVACWRLRLAGLECVYLAVWPCVPHYAFRDWNLRSRKYLRAFELILKFERAYCRTGRLLYSTPYWFQFIVIRKVRYAAPRQPQSGAP